MPAACSSGPGAAQGAGACCQRGPCALRLCAPLARWRNFLSPDIEHPRKIPFTDWEIAVVVQAQHRYGNNWKGAAPCGAGWLGAEEQSMRHLTTPQGTAPS